MDKEALSLVPQPPSSEPAETEAQVKARVASCTADLEAVLKRYNCGLDAVVEVRGSGNRTIVQVMPMNPPKTEAAGSGVT